MNKGVLVYDYDFMSKKRIGKTGFKKVELLFLGQKIKKINKRLARRKDEAELGFRKLPYQNSQQIMALAKKIRRQFSNLVVIGIGGSDLGAKAIYQALAGQYANQKANQNFKVYFLGDTTDPTPLVDLLKIVNINKTVFYVVSKSGNTIEPLANFLFVREQVIKQVGQQKHKKHFIITTNTKDGILLKIAQQEGYLVMPHYQVGGRFSVLSVNGLLPAAFAGFNIKELLKGAKILDKACQTRYFKQNPVAIFACLQYLAYMKHKQNVSVLMPYSYYLNEFGKWFRQLWGESLANKYNLKNRKINIGITPVSALGPSDQHSQIQLYIEGPNDKIVTFVKVDNLNFDFKVPKYSESEIKYLAGHKMSDILAIEHRATSVSLMKNKKPNGTIIIPQLNEYYLGQLFFFFEMAALYLGELFQVNVFNQPGVEQSKRYMSALLGRPGFEADKQEINNI